MNIGKIQAAAPVTTQISFSMTPERWHRLHLLFDQALALDRDRREQFVAAECADDAGLREQLWALLMASEGDDRLEQRLESAISSSMRHDVELSSGQSIGRYKVVRLLGRGGMGAVYLAERADKEFEQQVAVKVVGDGALSQRIAARLRGERQILANLNHPHIARLIDGGATNDGIPYLVMEYVEGCRIDQYCQEQQLDIRRRLLLFKQVCSAVQYAHQQLVIHRDIKPGNILVTAAGSAQLLDFGIAKLADPQSVQSVDLTQVHERLLTPGHASPEQVRGEPVGTASDIYALGVLLYELLTDRKPFDFSGMTLAQIEKAICEHTPPRPSEVSGKRELRGDLDVIAMKAQHKDATRRYASASALAEDVENYLTDRPIVARPDSLRYRAVKFWRRNRMAASTATAALVAVIAMTVVYTNRLSNARNAAELEARKSKLVADYLVEMFKSASPDVAQGKTITAVDLLNHGASALDARLSGDPHIHAEMTDVIASSFLSLGENAQALKLYQRLVELREQEEGRDTPAYARALMNLGNTHAVMGHEAEGEPLLEEALRLQETGGAATKLDQARTLLGLSMLCYDMNRYEESLAYIERAQRIVESERAQDTDLGAHVSATLALIMVELKHYDRAEAMFLETIAVRERLLGKRHPDTLSAKVNLALLMRNMGRYAQALPLMDELLTDKRAVLGTEHEEVGYLLYYIGGILAQTGDNEKADQLLRQSLQIIAARQGTRHRRYGVALRTLAQNELARGNYREAEKGFRQAREIEALTVAAGDQELFRTDVLIAASLRAQGRIAEADALLTPAIGFFELPAGSNMSKGNLWVEAGRLRLTQGRNDEARQYLLRGLAEQEADGIAMHPVTIGLLATLAEVQLRAGEYSDAVDNSRRALKIAMTATPDAQAVNENIRSILGAALYRLGEREEGERLIRSSYSALSKQRAASDVLVAGARQRLSLVAAGRQ